MHAVQVHFHKLESHFVLHALQAELVTPRQLQMEALSSASQAIFHWVLQLFVCPARLVGPVHRLMVAETCPVETDSIPPVPQPRVFHVLLEIIVLTSRQMLLFHVSPAHTP